jgi:2-polyprenyl-3-methyl-5-hydroxy-6-metoxy-1,4-benzoquinol methylase
MSGSATACGACGAAMHALFATRDYNRRVSDEAFRYARCPRCGLISLENVPRDLGRFYVQDYHAVPADAAAVEGAAARETYKIELVTRFARGGRLLEIGPSWGAFCLLARRAGFAVEAIEQDPRCRAFLESQIGVRAVHGADELDALARAGTPDVVALWHVFEHLRDPWRLLEGVASRLAPGGVLVIATPNPDAWQFRVFGRRWTHVDAPRHLHLVPAALLRERARSLGLEQLACTTTDTGGVGWDAFGWGWSLASFAPAGLARRAVRFGGRLLAPLAAPIERREGAGSAYTAVFRKAAR